MAETMVASLLTGPVTPNAPIGYLTRRAVEIVKLVGTSTAVDDTSNALTLKYGGKNPVVVGWSGGYSITSGAITFTAKFALGSNTCYVLVVYDESPPGAGF